MSSRVAGAALALLAAVTLVVSIAGIPAGWWAGHPLRNGEAMHKKDVDVSLLSAVGCNTGGDGRCEPLQLATSFDTIRYIELGASGLLALACLLLAVVALTGSDRRKPLGLVVIGLAVAGAVLAGALIFMPKLEAANIELPISSGIFVFFGGIASALLGSLLAMRPTPKLELQPPRQSFAPAFAAPPSAQPIDVLAMLHDSPAPDPLLARPPPSPGGQLAGPAGLLAPSSFGAPSFAQPDDAPAVLPPSPHPVPAPFSPRPGGPPLSTPPPPDARARPATVAPPLPGPDRAKSSSPMPALPGDRFKAAGPGSDRAKSASIAPPVPQARAKAASSAPPSAEARAKAASIPPPSASPRPKGVSVPAPSAEQRMKSPSTAPGPRPPATVAGVLPPPRPKAATGLPAPRGPEPSAPPPAPARPTTLAAAVPPPPIVATMLPMRAETDPGDLRETVEREAMTIARDGGSGGSIGDSTDASIALPDTAAVDEHTDIAAPPSPPPEPRDSASDIQTSMQRKLTPSELELAVARESQSEIETIAREKISARNLAVGDSTSPGIIAGRRSAQELKALGEAPTALVTSKIPVSTASESLPPPKPDEAGASGPTPACPQCEAPMAWVEEHLRFYCRSCRMYF